MLPQAANDAGQLIAELREATKDSPALIAKLNAATDTAGPDLVATRGAPEGLGNDHLASASEQLEGLAAENRGDLHGFVQQSLPQVEALLRDSREAARELSQSSRSLRENPAQLLYQSPGRRGDTPK